jgi:hypothetical protein
MAALKPVITCCNPGHTSVSIISLYWDYLILNFYEANKTWDVLKELPLLKYIISCGHICVTYVID